MPEKFQYFNGIKFTRDDKTGYYLNSTIRKRMHRYVWEFYNGPIPTGYCIHHKDKDKGNNRIENLELMMSGEHTSMHGIERDRRCHDIMCKNLEENAVPKAVEWHKSDAGREWHKQHYQETKDKLHAKTEKTCEYCGKMYSASDNTKSRFCSNKCKSAARRASGIDNEERKCVVCGMKFFVNKYSKVSTCSRSCANKIGWTSRRKEEIGA